MSFSNQVIIPRDPFKPHIVKMQGLWRVSPYRWKKLWSIGVSGYWDKAHAFTRKLNDQILAEQQAAKERQREFKRSPYRSCNFCGTIAEYTHRDGEPVCKCSNKECKPGRDRWLTYDEFEELGK